jgi:nucleoside-diphosphate-sugar epimerase
MNVKQGTNPQVDLDQEHVMSENEPHGAAGSPLHVVFGATGGIGRAVTEELVRRGRRVRAVSRSGAGIPGAEWIGVDASLPEAAMAAAAGAAVIYHCVNPGYTEWPELLPPVSSSILHAAEAAGGKLVYADNLYAYGPVEGPLREDLAAVATGRKGRTRVDVAAEMLAAQRDGRVRVAIGRASDYYGPHGANSNAGEPVFGRAMVGKRPFWNGRLDQPHTLHFLPDLARGLVTLADRREADGEVWHLPAAPPLTAQQFFDLILEAAGRPTPAKAQTLPPPMLAIAGLFSPPMRELRETTYQFNAPFVIDSSKFERAFGAFDATPQHDAIKQTVQWFRSRGG